MNPKQHTDILAMLKEMSALIRANPTYKVIRADSPPRIGFVAYDTVDNPEAPDDMRGWWQISLVNLKWSASVLPKCVISAFKSTEGRRDLCERMGELFQ